MTRELRTVQQAAKRRTSADSAYRDALAAARSRHTFAEIGAAAGVTAQAVYQLLRRHTPKEG